MSFDTLLTLVFVVVFIVLPLVSRVLRERNRPPTAQRGGTPPRAPEGTVLDGTPPAADGELPAWLAEAQRRVREARERATAEASTQSGTLQVAGAGRSLRDGGARRPAAPPGA